MIVGQGKSLMIAVLAMCGLLAVGILFLIGLAVQARVNRYMDERKVLEVLAGNLPAPDAISDAHLPSPAANPALWFGPDAYPATALRASEEGRVRVKVAVSSEGKPIGCLVLQSSGYGDLDQGTCDVVMDRGRFLPATNRAGQAVPAIWHSPSVIWKLAS